MHSFPGHEYQLDYQRERARINPHNSHAAFPRAKDFKPSPWIKEMNVSPNTPGVIWFSHAIWVLKEETKYWIPSSESNPLCKSTIRHWYSPCTHQVISNLESIVRNERQAPSPPRKNDIGVPHTVYSTVNFLGLYQYFNLASCTLSSSAGGRPSRSGGGGGGEEEKGGERGREREEERKRRERGREKEE